MRVAASTLYVQQNGAVLRLDHDTVLVCQDSQVAARIPLHHVQSIVALGRVSMTSPLLERCARDGRSVVRMDGRGRFLYRLQGPVTGNVLLRTAQYRLLSDPARQVPLIQAIVAGKIYNARQNLMRAARDRQDQGAVLRLREAAGEMTKDIRRLPAVTDIEVLRGVEGVNARRYFACWSHMMAATVDPQMELKGRTRRPPRDPVNAALSLLYGLLRHDVMGALESVGLDPQAGYLHTLRPGRPGLALDLMEEFRPVLADRVAITLFNRRQLQPADFEALPGGAVSLTDRGRREIIEAYESRKQAEVEHPQLRARVPLGQVILLQAQLLARAIRRNGSGYVPYLHRG
ncbi:MAG: type I-C CRISPR-associated endonuclease Cas1c [Alicyclobacillus sp.]|nr:type I-C CRISPR-associated endonuclease Cas1c [Alicyclobacillus sp.]